MIQLIVNADDFGFSKAVNYGIYEAHKNGIVNSTTLMMNTSGTSHAIKMAKETPSLKVGIHLVLTYGKPLSENVPSLVDKDNHFKKQLEVLTNIDSIDLYELELEWTNQIKAFLATGLKPTHFDSHHHLHGIKAFYPVVKRLSEKFQLPIRKISGDLEGISTFSDVFLMDFYGESATIDFFNQISDIVKDGQVVEVMCHPGYIDHELSRGSSYNAARLNELSILTSVQLPVNIQLL